MQPDPFFWYEFAILAAILPPTLMALLCAPWVPTPKQRVRKMLELANAKIGTRLYDIGCGDGRMVHMAAKEFGARATGLELSPLIYLMAKIRLFFLFSRAKILFEDCRGYALHDAEAILCYMLPDFLKKVRTKFERELPDGCRVVSYAFKIDGWIPIHIEAKDDRAHHAAIYVYEMPYSKNQASPMRGVKTDRSAQKKSESAASLERSQLFQTIN